MGPIGLVVSIALLGCATVLATRLKSKYFRGLSERHIFHPKPIESGPLVSCIIPARNEADSIAALLTGLRCQRYPNIEVIVVDDASEDATIEVVARCREADPRIKLVSAPPLPQGWTGKCNACRHGTAAAVGEYLLYLDSDVWLTDENAIGGMVAYARTNDVDLLSLVPRQVLGSFMERLLLPAVYTIMALELFPYGATNNPRSRKAAAVGQCLFFKREAYEAVGGHESVKGEIAEDMAFAKLVKAAGMRLTLLDGGNVMSVRMYRSLGDIWGGWTKHLYLTVAGGLAVLLRRELMLATVFLVPPAVLLWAVMSLAVDPAWLTLIPLVLTIGMEIWGHKERLKNYRIMKWPARYEPLFAPAMAFALLLLAASAVKHWTPGGLTWKGRRYSASDLRP
jgi:chlorobactene glucosyltransferase